MWKVIESKLKEMDKTIYWLAKETGISRQAIYQMRDGEIKQLSLNAAFKIADALQIDVNEFRVKGGKD